MNFIYYAFIRGLCVIYIHILVFPRQNSVLTRVAQNREKGGGEDGYAPFTDTLLFLSCMKIEK